MHVMSQSVPLVPFLQEIGKNAVFVEGTTGTTDICQGQLGEPPLPHPLFIRLGNLLHSSINSNHIGFLCLGQATVGCWPPCPA